MFLSDQEAQKHLGTQTEVESVPEWIWGVRERYGLEVQLKEVSWVGVISKAHPPQRVLSQSPGEVKRFPSCPPHPKHRETGTACLTALPPAPSRAAPSTGIRGAPLNLCVSTSLRSAFFLPINTSVLPLRRGSGPWLLSDCLVSTALTLKPRPAHMANVGDPLGEEPRVPSQPSLLLLAGGKKGNTGLGMAETFRGWCKGSRLSCLQPAEDASSPRWRKPAALAEN